MIKLRKGRKKYTFKMPKDDTLYDATSIVAWVKLVLLSELIVSDKVYF